MYNSKMLPIVLLVLLSGNLAMAKPRYEDLNEDEQLFRAAYDTPSYDHDDFEDEEDMHSGQLDLLKDALWAVKAKLKELKAFNKALAANLLSTKLKVKELIAYQMSLKAHHHEMPVKRNAIHNYQPVPHLLHDPQVPQHDALQHEHNPYHEH